MLDAVNFYLMTRQKKILCFAVYSVHFLPLKNKYTKSTCTHFKRNCASIVCLLATSQATEVSYSQQK